VTFAEDLSYNHGAMLSQLQFDEFLTPYSPHPSAGAPARHAFAG
jgi:hypothetical protein